MYFFTYFSFLYGIALIYKVVSYSFYAIKWPRVMAAKLYYYRHPCCQCPIELVQMRPELGWKYSQTVEIKELNALDLSDGDLICCYSQDLKGTKKSRYSLMPWSKIPLFWRYGPDYAGGLYLESLEGCCSTASRAVIKDIE